MVDERITAECFFCGRKFQFGPHRYEGKHIARYRVSVCDGCYKGNWDGWAPDFEAKLLPYLQEKGMPIPERNEKGWLPRD